jgi:hypothetical protein
MTFSTPYIIVQTGSPPAFTLDASIERLNLTEEKEGQTEPVGITLCEILSS